MQAKVYKAPTGWDVLGEHFEKAWVGHEPLGDIIDNEVVGRMETGEYTMVSFTRIEHGNGQINLIRSDSVPPFRCRYCGSAVWVDDYCPDCEVANGLVQSGYTERFLKDNEVVSVEPVEDFLGHTPFSKGHLEALVKSGVVRFLFDSVNGDPMYEWNHD